MSFIESSMAAQGGASDITITITAPIASNNQKGQASPSSAAHVNSFVRTARSYLKKFERSLSFSTVETSKDEDPSSMTIEFLKSQLQAQRAENKAVKQKAQQLTNKVLELEQRLNTETERRKKAEHHIILLSRNKLRKFHSYNERMELANFKETSSAEEHSDCWSEISGSEDDIFLILPSSLGHRLEIRCQKHQCVTNRHECFCTKDSNEPSVINTESTMLHDQELRDKTSERSNRELYKPEGSDDFNSTNTWHNSDSIDPQPSKIAHTVNMSSSKHEEPLDAEHLVFKNEMVSKADSEKLHYINITKEMTPQSIDRHEKPIFASQNCQQTIPQNQIHPDGIMYDDLSHLKRVYAIDPQTPLEAERSPGFGTTVQQALFKGIDQHQILSYSFAHSDINKDGPEKGPTLKEVTSGEYVKAILPLDVIKNLEDHQISLLRLSFEKLPCPCKRTNPNPFSSPLRRYRMSLDGGMDRLEKKRPKDRHINSRQSIS
ncbi:hypothetical protein L7F22_010606 [Adiantum nelumboides]|nr:hypothetical protein [Adiantum nelumboides]